MPKAIEMDPSYPVYCVYIPTGMNADYEVEMIKRLKVWGESMGTNVFVADWDIGHPNYMDLREFIRPSRLPMIFFTDSSKIDSNTFILAVDDPKLMKNNDQLCELLPQLANLIMNKDYAKATKAARETQQKNKFQDIVRRVTGSKFNVALSGFGVTLSIGNK